MYELVDIDRDLVIAISLPGVDWADLPEPTEPSHFWTCRVRGCHFC